jgi:hypothetical protein
LTDLFLRKKPYLKGTSFSTCDVPNSSSNQIKLKLYLREKDDEILFAQGEEDFADFLFSFLTFPLGGVVRMLGGNSSLGCIDSLYKSILDLDGYKYLMSHEVKNKLVDPCIAPQFKLSKQILQIYEPRASSYYCYCQRSFRESIIHDQFSITYGFKAFNILNETFTTLKLVDPKSSKEAQQEGYVKGSTLFMATNDLVIEPMSPISALSLLNSLETLPSNLTEKVVFIGVKEVQKSISTMHIYIYLCLMLLCYFECYAKILNCCLYNGCVVIYDIVKNYDNNVTYAASIVVQ